MRKLIYSFKYAFKGLKYAATTQLNFRIHCIAAIFAVVLGVVLDIDILEWLWIAFAIASVIAAELFNTAIEIIVDLVSPDKNVKAGAIKDVAAAAVLITAIFALTIGLFIFVPKI